MRLHAAAVGLAFALLFPGGTAARSAPGHAVLAMHWQWPHSALVRADPVTFGRVGSAGLRLVDTRTWTSKRVDPKANAFLFAHGLVLASAGTGITAYRLDGRRVWRLDEGNQWTGAFSLTQPYLYVDRSDEAVDVVSIQTGKVLRSVARSQIRPLADPDAW